MSQRWFITGSSRGIGRALSEAVLNAGHRLVASARETALLADLLDRYGDAVRTVALDVTDPIAANEAMRVASDNFGGIDVLVNNAGYGNINSVEDTIWMTFAGRSKPICSEPLSLPRPLSL